VAAECPSGASAALRDYSIVTRWSPRSGCLPSAVDAVRPRGALAIDPS
jgi:hypothetical protein